MASIFDRIKAGLSKTAQQIRERLSDVTGTPAPAGPAPSTPASSTTTAAPASVPPAASAKGGLPARRVTEADTLEAVEDASNRRGEGYADGEMVWGEQRQLELQPEEALDGADNDDDGLVDEHRLVWTQGTRSVTWARGIRAQLEGEIPNDVDDNGNGMVDERGLCFRLDGDTLTIALSVETRDPDRRLVVRTATTAIRLRN